MNVLIFWVCHTNTQQLTTWADSSPHCHRMMFFGLIQLIALQKSSEFLIEKQTYKCNKLTSATNSEAARTRTRRSTSFVGAFGTGKYLMIFFLRNLNIRYRR